jgi:hypothetical protein
MIHRRTIVRLLALISALWISSPAMALPSRPPELVLTGTIVGTDHETYKAVTFDVPVGTKRISVDFAYSGREDRTTVDLGLRDPERFRGWSGGNKAQFTVSASDATPSYLSGPLPAGVWSLVLGVPNIRPEVKSAYTAKIWLDGADMPFEGFSDAPIKTGARWYRGDLHVHTGHSDGSCLSRNAKKIPCPVFRSLQTANEAKLDFVAITEHNATSHFQALRELQPYFDDLLLIPGREMTTFNGHANLFGVVDPIEFQIGTPFAPTLAVTLDKARSLGGLVSINHPSLPSGEVCMGCGWTAQTPWSAIDAIEVINGGSVRSAMGKAEALSGIGFWHKQLDAGLAITAIGGSDNHDPDRPVDEAGSVGQPATAVFAQGLSQSQILEAIRKGQVFIDLDSEQQRTLDFRAEAGQQVAVMGQNLIIDKAATVRFIVTLEGGEGTQLQVIDSAGTQTTLSPLIKAKEARWFSLKMDHQQRRWVRLNLRAADGRLLMISNPIYINFKSARFQP